MISNDIAGAFIAGILSTLFAVGIFQFGLNIGINIAVKMLDGNYPAAMQFLKKNKRVASIYPYVVGQHE